MRCLSVRCQFRSHSTNASSSGAAHESAPCAIAKSVPSQGSHESTARLFFIVSSIVLPVHWTSFDCLQVWFHAGSAGAAREQPAQALGHVQKAWCKPVSPLRATLSFVRSFVSQSWAMPRADPSRSLPCLVSGQAHTAAPRSRPCDSSCLGQGWRRRRDGVPRGRTR